MPLTFSARKNFGLNSFNILNGIPATGNSFLQRDILKGKWKFDGFVVTDYTGINEMIDDLMEHISLENNVLFPRALGGK